MNNKYIYLVVYSNWESSYRILGAFTDEKNALKCFEYEKKKNKPVNTFINDVSIKFEKVNCSDDIDFDAKLFELIVEENKKRLAEEEKIKQRDLEEFYRIKEKYGL
jgi:hypothetical protein